MLWIFAIQDTFLMGTVYITFYNELSVFEINTVLPVRYR